MPRVELVGGVVTTVVKEGYLEPGLSWEGLHSSRSSGGRSIANNCEVRCLGTLYVNGLCVVHNCSQHLQRSLHG